MVNVSAEGYLGLVARSAWIDRPIETGARWSDEGDGPDPIRNREMPRLGSALGLALYGHSKGSRSMRNEALNAGPPSHGKLLGDNHQHGLSDFA